jgi:hypothetical protein
MFVPGSRYCHLGVTIPYTAKGNNFLQKRKLSYTVDVTCFLIHPCGFPTPRVAKKPALA